MKSACSLDGIFKPISDSLLSPFPNGICNPIPDIIHQQCYFRRVQISGHSSVLSSSTFRSQKEDNPIYILRFKKIEQGQLLYPKIFPPIFTQDMLLEALNRYRYRIRNFKRLLTDVPWLDTRIESLNSSCRRALAGYRYRIYNQLLTDMPRLDTGIESGILRL